MSDSLTAQTDTSSGAGAPQSSSASTSKHTSIGAIAGGIVGGLVVFALVLGLILVLLKRRRRNRDVELPTPDASSYPGSPYVYDKDGRKVSELYQRRGTWNESPIEMDAQLQPSETGEGERIELSAGQS